MVRSVMIKLFVKFILLMGGKLENRADGVYLVWEDTGFMSRPPMVHHLKLDNFK